MRLTAPATNGAIQNFNTLRAVTGGTLNIFGDLIQFGSARTSTDESGVVRFELPCTVTGGELDASAGGQIEFDGDTVLNSLILRGRVVALQSADLTFSDTVQPVRNEGIILPPADGSGDLLFMLSANPTIDLLGQGTIRFEGTTAFANSRRIALTNPASLQFLRMAGQSLQGSFRIEPNIRVGGTLSPGLAAPNRLGIVRFDRTLRMNSGSTVEIDVQGIGPANRDVLEAATTEGKLILDSDATLRVRLGGGYVPANDDLTTVIDLSASSQADPISGSFTSVLVGNAPPGVGAVAVYTTNLVRVRWTVETPCDSIDFNNDTSLFDPMDISAFLSVYSEGPCIPASATCNDIDFNNDSSLFDPCDINAFLTLYAEGPCTACGQ